MRKLLSHRDLNSESLHVGHVEPVLLKCLDLGYIINCDKMLS